MTTSGIAFVEITADRVVIRHKIDCVGNNLTATLRWCAAHMEPVWLFNDGSWECPQTAAVGWDTGDHILTHGPWEHVA